MALRRGFKGEAEQTSEQLRGELGLTNLDRLDPHRLLRHLDLPAISLTQLAGMSSNGGVRASVAFLQGEDWSSLSAFTVFRGRHRLIVYNDAHDEERLASDLCHEAAHGILLHPPTPALDGHGCRQWNGDYEAEADYLAGTLLIPGKAARYAAKANWSLDDVATRFGCSPWMARWRNNASGGQRFRRG